jgi:diguanylate cyclase (GGDEF)-like protein
MQDIDDAWTRKLTRTLLLVSSLGFGLATVIHYLDPTPRPLDQILPPINCLTYLGLLAYYWHHPASQKIVFRLWLYTILSTLAISAWYFVIKVVLSDQLQLSEELPPLAPALLMIHATTSIFAEPKESFKVGLISWLLIALPILGYLVSHPSDLFTPRGIELFVMFGPAMLFSVVFLEFNKITNQRIATLTSEREAMEALAIHDPLTQVYNRRGIERILFSPTFNQTANPGLILFDLDHFKQINDRYGHDTGDRVLQAVAQRCQHSLRQADLLARWGGEEFLIVIQDIPEDVLFGIAEGLRKLIAQHPIGPIAKVTASFGVTKLTHRDTIHDGIKRADRAMYTAKQQGRDQVIWG